MSLKAETVVAISHSTPVYFKLIRALYSMSNAVIERIARHADIDTRRAMGFLPRKIALPDLNLPFDSKEYIEFAQGISRFIKLRNAHLHVCRNEIVWVVGTDDFMTNRTYSFRRDDGFVSFYALLKTELSRHPDLNEDGSFRRDRAKLTLSSPHPVIR